ncbi:hypothetical protein F0U60_36980 [Archangium minus]|uniref:Lipoprotein n=1 Tax=Archangium minus TaxID=83450 RepID=A0ABY9X122_9BACT|nr:hypothetical protein F0U60_36980 [Archangium minus]
MKTNVWMLAAIAVLGLNLGCKTAYNKITVEKLKDVVGTDYDSYRWFSYPTDNFGVGTAYASKERFKKQVSICDSANCFGVSPASFDEWLALKGFAGVGKNGPTITLSEEEKTKLSAELDGPKVAQLLNLGANVNYTKGVTTEVRLGRAYPRRLLLQPTLDYISKLDSSQLVKKAFDAGTLILIANDLVMEGLSVNLCVDKSINPELTAKLDNSVGKIIGANAAVAMKVETATTGCYTLAAQQPIVVAALAVEQPAAGELSTNPNDEWQGWTRHKLLDIKLD